MNPTICNCETCKGMKKEINNPKCVYCNEHHDPRVHCIEEVAQGTIEKPSKTLLKKTSEYYVEVFHGKYAVYQPVGGSLKALRHGEPWRDLCGDNLVFHLMVELIEAKAKEKMRKSKECQCKELIHEYEDTEEISLTRSERQHFMEANPTQFCISCYNKTRG